MPLCYNSTRVVKGRRHFVLCALASFTAAAVAAVPASTHAGRPRWPTPAAGPSTSGDPEVLFTFDDGPHETYTPQILDALAAHGVKAIFFWVGWRLGERGAGPKRRAVVARAVAEGHVVGNHTMSHPHLCKLKPDKLAWELDEAFRLLSELSGTEVRLFRSPYGGKCERLEEMLAARGVQHMHWDMDAREYLHHDGEQMKKYFVGRLSRLEGRAVILIHDTHAVSAKVLPKLLAWIDEENARRVAAGRRPIRIISYTDLAREQIPPAVASAARDVTDAVLAFAPAVLAELVLPLFGPAPPPRAEL